jgi:hypothetical protein
MDTAVCDLRNTCSIDKLLPTFLQVFEAGVEGTSWNAAQLLCCGCLNGQIVIVVMTYHWSFESWE